VKTHVVAQRSARGAVVAHRATDEGSVDGEDLWRSDGAIDGRNRRSVGRSLRGRVG
jgi:hypothetical protein